VGASGVFGFSGAQVTQCVIAVLFIIYLFAVLRWLNHRLEHEADLFAAMELGPNHSPQTNQHTRSALEKLGAIAPQQLNRSTFLHPSISSRIALLESAERDGSIAKTFQRSLRRRNLVILIPWVALLLIAASSSWPLMQTP
jgi:Zn-dependent protease with chaperone function